MPKISTMLRWRRRRRQRLTPCETFHIIDPARCVAAARAAASRSRHRPRRRPLTADQIARRVQDRDTGRDSRADADEAVRPARPRRERALTLARPLRRPDGDRLLIRFTYPNDIRGTGFLVWEHPKADDERFLYLPSLGRVRRIAGTETQESFVGSDFTYEDIGGREFDDYTYALLDENASWTPPAGGAARPAWRLESRRKDAVRRVPARRLLVLKDSFVVVPADIYNRRNEKQKVYTVRRLEQVEGIWTAMDAEMTNASRRRAPS